MKNVRQYVPLVIDAVAIAGGYVIANPILFALCQNVYKFNNYLGCLDNSVGNIGKPLFIFSLYALPICIILLFIRKEIFRIWLKFAVIWLILSALVIVITPVSTSQWMPLYFIGKTAITQGMSVLFVIISLILIAWKSFAVRRSA